MALLLALTCFSGCKTTTSTETSVETGIPTNGVVVTVDPVEETADAEQILSESINK